MSRPTTLPNFLVIGAAKSGTTSLFSYLAEHPQVFMSEIKEPNFFALEGGRLNLKGPIEEERVFRLMHRKSVTEESAYVALFADAAGEPAIGEASPRYLYAERAARAIHDRLGRIKLIAILRHPTARAYSHFQMNRRRGAEPLERFADALDAEDARVAQGFEWDWHYVRLGRYAEQLERFIALFGRESLLVLLYDDLKRDPAGVMRRCYAHLGVDPAFVPDVGRRHKEGLAAGTGPLSRLIAAPEDTWLGRMAYKVVPRKLGFLAQEALLRLLGRVSKEKPAAIDAADKARIDALFANEIDKLEALTGIDLEVWRKKG